MPRMKKKPSRGIKPISRTRSFPVPIPQKSVARVVIERVRPEIDGGKFPIKRTLGEIVVVEADIFADAHEIVSCRLLFRHAKESRWREVPMVSQGNDRWRGSFVVEEEGRYFYTLMGWVDAFQSWRRDMLKKVEANQDVRVDLWVGAQIIEEASVRADTADARRLRHLANSLCVEHHNGHSTTLQVALGDELSQLMNAHPDRARASVYDKELVVWVHRAKAGFSAWYELFPRSCSMVPGRQGTLKDCQARLSDVSAMGFDVLYLPPIHPIGFAHRKGKNNAPTATSKDPGSPWAIGSAAGGHKAVDPRLGSLKDFQNLVRAAARLGIEVALDLAFQCSPDHPYVKEHPEWFRIRPDGSVQFAENPPKKYEDIYPLNFESAHWRSLWEELYDVVLFWIQQGVRIFRVDNPHTKPFAFWEWLINGINREYPDVIFLSEAFTRPKVMYRLAKLGFTQSYTYFAWRNTKQELTEYFTELTKTDVHEYFRYSLWPNTPDILTESLQSGGKSAFITRLILAASLGASYGIYGPAFELCEHTPRDPGSEEYRDSEKYEIKWWNLKCPESLRGLIARVNWIRRENPALQSDGSLHFHSVDNEWLIAYSKQTKDSSNIILVVANLDSHATQIGWVHLALDVLGLDPSEPYSVHDLLTDARYLWQGSRNYVSLNPFTVPAHIFQINPTSQNS